MIPGEAPCFPNTSEPEGGIHHPSQLYHDVMEASFSGGAGGSETQLRSLLCSLSILKQKVHEVESLVSLFLSQESQHQHQTQPAATLMSASAVPFASIGTMIQEVVVTASSMMFNCQQMTLGSSQTGNNSNSNSDSHMQAAEDQHHIKQQIRPDDGLQQFVGCGVDKNNNNNQGFLDNESLYNWYNDNTATCNNNYISTRTDSCSKTTTAASMITAVKGEKLKDVQGQTSNKMARDRKSLPEAYDLVEPDAEDLLAKYTHYCQVCGKGFKRDANLRMHMRAHGDEYKSTAALSNPLKKETDDQNSAIKIPRKYSCPQMGCRWNKNHAKFQPLKSIICVKNHYKRSHCPKMYACKRCNRKQFSVLSDLRTHEKHCGDRKWQCSCGTTFSRKDKLLGHVALFIGHTPIVVNPLVDSKFDNHGEVQIQFEES